jgi:hypothetical protein
MVCHCSTQRGHAFGEEHNFVWRSAQSRHRREKTLGRSSNSKRNDHPRAHECCRPKFTAQYQLIDKTLTEHPADNRKRLQHPLSK